MAVPIFLVPKDLLRLPDFSNYHYESVRLLYNRIKERLGKEKHQRITLVEFATYMGVEVDEIAHFFTIPSKSSQ